MHCVALVGQLEVCAPCCEGSHSCSGDLVCKTTEGAEQPGGFCVHADAPTECSLVGPLQDVLCDSCLPDTNMARRFLTGKDNPAPGPAAASLPYCLQLAALQKIEDIVHYLQSQPWSGRAVIRQLEGLLHTLEALIAANFLRGAWVANPQATTKVVVANWKTEAAASTKVNPCRLAFKSILDRLLCV